MSSSACSASSASSSAPARSPSPVPPPISEADLPASWASLLEMEAAAASLRSRLMDAQADLAGVESEAAGLPYAPGVFHATCRPEDGGEGIQRAIDDCPEGGSIQLLAGKYFIDLKGTLRIRRNIRIVGQGDVLLDGHTSNGFEQFALVESDAPAAALIRLRMGLFDEGHAEGGAAPVVRVNEGHLWLLRCEVTSLTYVSLVHVKGYSCRADIVGCTLRQNGHGEYGVFYVDGAAGRVVACELHHFKPGKGVTLFYGGSDENINPYRVREGKEPLVPIALNTYRD